MWPCLQIIVKYSRKQRQCHLFSHQDGKDQKCIIKSKWRRIESNLRYQISAWKLPFRRLSFKIRQKSCNLALEWNKRNHLAILNDELQGFAY